MNIEYYRLCDGVMEFHGDKLLIFDKAKRNRRDLLFNAISGLILGVTFLIRGYLDGEPFFFYLGLITAILWAAFFVFRREHYQKVENEIPLSVVSDVVFRFAKDGSVTVVIKTMQKLSRRISFEDDAESNLRFKNHLEKLQIPVTIQP